MQLCHLPLTSPVKQLFRCTAMAYLSWRGVCCPPRKMSQMAHQREDSLCSCTHFTTNCYLGVAVPLPCSLSFFSSQLFFILIQWNVLTGIDRAFYWSFLTGIDGLLCFKMNQLRSYQVPERENYIFKQWLNFSLFREAKWPSTSSTSTVAILVPKLEPPTCLYCTDIRIIISFLAVRID